MGVDLRIVALGLFVWASSTTPVRAAECFDVAGRGLRLLTINLLFSEVETRDERLQAIADFASGDGEDRRPIDVILLQEVVGGFLAGTANSARDLQRFLAGRGGDYERRTAFEVGIPGLLAVANAVLSRCDIRFGLVKRLPRASEIELGDRTIRLPRNVMLTRLEVPGFGHISVYNTHLCASCLVEERAEQLDVAFDFINGVEDFLPGPTRAVFGGDFNIDINRDQGAEAFLYDRTTATEGFADLYAAAPDVGTLPTLCPNENEADEHCTVGVSDLNGSTSRRIDYLFGKGLGDVMNGAVVFNPLIDPAEPTVSDHAGVFVEMDPIN